MDTPLPRRWRVAVMGAGAVGCFYGGLLARAGHDVVLIGRPAHVDAIRAHGLRLELQASDAHVAVAAATEAQAAAGAELVLFCVKSTDTEAAAAQLRPHLAADTLVLSLQNGVDNADRLRAVLPQPVAATVVYVAAGMAGPGHLRHHGRGELRLEPGPRAEAIAALFTSAGMPTDVDPNVRGALWAKLVMNCAYNALSALTQRPYGWLVQQPGVAALQRDVMDECLAVARADGVDMPPDVEAGVRRIAETMPTQRSSTAQDLARGHPSEIDHLNGFVVRRGDALGVATPVNRALWTLVKMAEQRNA